MLKGKHIIITLLIIGLLWLNWFLYTTFQLVSSGQLTGDDVSVILSISLIIIESVLLLAVIICNLDKMWNWQFNLNRWVCKLKH